MVARATAGPDVAATFLRWTYLRAVSVVWVDRHTTSDVRATVHSLLSQAESVGEICGGFTLALLARAAGTSVVLITAAALIAGAGAMVIWARRAGGGAR